MAFRIPRIAHRAMMAVDPQGSKSELHAVRLPHHHHALTAQRANDLAFRLEFLRQSPGTPRIGAIASYSEYVLDRDRDAVERASGNACM